MRTIFNSYSKKLYRILFVLSLFLSSFYIGIADTAVKICDPATSGQICNPIKINTLNGFIQKILEGVIKIGIPVVALAVVYSGFLFVKAQGNSEEIGKAKDALLYTLIGAAILFGSWAIAQLISETVIGISLL